MNKPSSPEHVVLKRIPQLDNLEIMQAHYLNHSFPRHTHDGFGVGVIEQGSLEFYYRGENVVAPKGTINLVNPDEVHTGHARTEAGWTYRMFYFSPDILQKAASEIREHPAAIPFFQKGVINDPELASSCYSLHKTLSATNTSLLEKESRFLALLINLITRHADSPPSTHHTKNAIPNIVRVQEYISNKSDQDLSLDELSNIANMSKYHFIRSFKSQVGLPPHAYLIQTRVKKAKVLLAHGKSIAEAAYITGFADQSHLTRIFKNFFGYTPGKYSNIVQDY